jgi:hypothetical protein
MGYFEPTAKKEIKGLFKPIAVEKDVQPQIMCRFRCERDLQDFAQKNNLKLTQKTKSVNFVDGSLTTLNSKQSITELGVFDVEKKKKDWEYHWAGMPEYISYGEKAYTTIAFNFNDLKQASTILMQSITSKTKSVWYPKLVQGENATLRVVGGPKHGKYPIYVVSKSRSDNCTTSRFLSQMEVPHFVVVEPCDVELYKEKVENQYATILELDMKYKDDYDCFDDLGDTKSKGPGAARNFCWDDSIKCGYKMHWVMDDNANEGFHCINENKKRKCRTGAMFLAAENFVGRYDNVAISGLNYTKFCPENSHVPPYVTNTRIYSFLLIRNDIPYRWRGRYNEDTDICLRVLKDGWCTIQFNAFLAGKCTTQKVKGGNTEVFYSKEGTYPKSKMLEDMHPDVAKVVWKFNRWHHYVDYRGFTQKLHYREGYKRPELIDNYGMITIDTKEKDTYDTRSYLENKYKKEIERAKGERK